MMTPLNDLTIVSITFNNPGIHKTIESLKPLLHCGAQVLIHNGGKPITIEAQNLTIYNEEDSGIYDALNKGIRKVDSAFFMLLHAGDEFIGSQDSMAQIITDLMQQGKDLSLNSQLIGSRKHSSRLWNPWMLNFGAQPPHLPCIYRTKSFKLKPYNLEIPIIADFDFFRAYSWSSYVKHNFVLVQMEQGGATSGGISSFVRVSLLMIRHYRLAGCFMAICRVPLKAIQMIF